MRLGTVNGWAGMVILALFLWTAIGGLGSNFYAGEPILGLLGAIFSLAAGVYFLVRRNQFFANTKGLFADFHLLLGCAGVGFILIHAGGTFFGWTGLLTIAITVLFLLGLNLRFFTARQINRIFLSRPYLFFNAPQNPISLDLIIQDKKALLAQMDPRAVEETFGLRWHDWLRSPAKAVRYFWLVQKEKKWVRKACGNPPAYLGFSLGLGRFLHIGLGIGAMIGLLFHLLQSCPYFVF